MSNNQGTPVSIASLSITYLDENGDTQSLVQNTDYVVDDSGLLARLYPPSGISWPLTLSQPASVTIEWNAGYTDADSVPDELKAAIKLIVAGMYENREHFSAVPSTYKENPTVKMLLGHFRVMEAQ